LADKDTVEKHGENPEAQLARYILAGSGTMIGICTTLVGLVKIVEGRLGPSSVDAYVALIALMFLGSAILSYLSIRNERHLRSSRPLGRTADVLFLAGLFCIVLLVVLFAVEQV
jgi:putative flippase GtrA